MVFKKLFGTAICTTLFSPLAFAAISFNDMEEILDTSALPPGIQHFYLDTYGISNDGRYTFHRVSKFFTDAKEDYDQAVITDRYTGNTYVIDGLTSTFHLEGMSGNGRFMFTKGGEILDLKTGTSNTINSYLSADSLSDNGRYATFYSNQDPLNLGVTCGEVYSYDIANPTINFISAAFGTTSGAVCEQSGYFGISGDGTQIFWDSDSSDDSGLTYGPYPNPVNRDLYSVNWQVAVDTTQRVSLPDGETQENTTGGSALYDASVTPDGLHIAFKSYFQYIDEHDPSGTHIYVRDVNNLAVEAITVDSNGDLVPFVNCEYPSISDDARYVVFSCNQGSLIPGAGPGIYVRDRETQTTHYISEGSRAKISGNGQYIILMNGSARLMQPHNSDDGIYLVANPAARNPLDRPTYSSNYMYVSVPNSDTNWQAYDGLSLVDNYLWKGTVVFDGLNGDAFKLDVGGSWVNGSIQHAAPWQNNYGDNNADGYLDANGGNISITQGAGVYEITFNESSMQYSVVKLSNYSTLYVRGTNNNWGVTRMAYIGFNTWEAVVTFNGAHDERFKLDAKGDWQTNLGDNGANGTLELNGADIYVPYANGKYRIQFYQDTMHYSIQAL